ncbi:MAG TPA: hypothetical protein VGO51_10175 [Burkholderiaceae bacterium]|nr:hypothetical protein [Burkholderiaceae bacterium]
MQNNFLRFPIRTVIATATVALFSGPASGFAPGEVCAATGICGLAQAIDDEQMAGVAGKFTIAGEVVGMNLIMTSSWQAANGQRLDAAAALSVALPNSGHAQAHFSASASATDPQNSENPPPGSTGIVSQGSGLQSIAGVAQVIQVAGDGNGASNRASVQATTNNVVASGGNEQLKASYVASNGAEAVVSIANNGVSLRLTVPAVGNAQQQVNMAGMGSIQQNIQIAASRQQVVNQMQLQLQLLPYSNAVLASQGLSQSLNMLRGR